MNEPKTDSKVVPAGGRGMSEVLPTKNGYEAFRFRPIHLNEKWIGKASVATEPKKEIEVDTANVFKNTFHKEVEQRCANCKRTDTHYCSYCLSTLFVQHMRKVMPGQSAQMAMGLYDGLGKR